MINLAPADLKKDAGGFDLPIALGLLTATGQLLPEQLRDFASVGELALDGTLRPVKGALSIAMAAAAAGVPKLLTPAANAREAARRRAGRRLRSPFAGRSGGYSVGWSVRGPGAAANRRIV